MLKKDKNLIIKIALSTLIMWAFALGKVEEFFWIFILLTLYLEIKLLRRFLKEGFAFFTLKDNTDVKTGSTSNN